MLTREGIKRTTLEYCRSTLANNEPDNEYREIVEEKLKSMDNIVKGKEGVFRIDKVTFYKVIKNFSKSGKRNYDFLVKAGDNFKEAI